MRYEFGTVTFPQWVAFFGIERHTKNVLASDRNVLGIPDKFARTGKGEIANIRRFKSPGFSVGFLFFFCHFCFRLRNN